MSMSVKISDELLKDAREEAKATDRSITSQIEHWARLGRRVERGLRHEEVVNLKRPAPEDDPVVQSILVKLERAISGDHRELGKQLMKGRTVYQGAGDGRVERIEADGTRSIGHFVDKRFVPDEPKRKARRR
jgi:ParD-like antitoxin of type II bacterial toxin-antitoxin system